MLLLRCHKYDTNETGTTLAFNVLVDEPIIDVTLRSGERARLVLADLVRRADEIAQVNEDALTRLSLTEWMSVFLIAALEQSKVIPLATDESHAVKLLDDLYAVEQSAIVEAVNSYIPTANERGFFDLDHDHGFGQAKDAPPPPESSPSKFGALDLAYEVEQCTREPLTKARVAKSLITMRNRGRGGVHSMRPDSSGKTAEDKGKYPLAGPLLRTTMAFVEGATYRDTLIGFIAAHVLADRSLPAWEIGPGDPQGDKLGTRIKGPRTAMTVITRVPYLEFDDSGVLSRVTISNGDSLPKEMVYEWSSAAKMVVRKDAKTGEDVFASPMPNYGSALPPRMADIYAVASTVEGKANRAVAAAARYAREERKSALSVTVLSLVHSNLSKISVIGEDTFVFPVEIFPESVEGARIRPIISERASQSAQCAERALKCAFLVYSGVRDIGKPSNKKRESEKPRFESAERVRDSLIAELGEAFQRWILALPQLPSDPESDDELMSAHVESWNETAFSLATDTLDTYLTGMPQQWWVHRDAAGIRAKTIAGLRTSLGTNREKES